MNHGDTLFGSNKISMFKSLDREKLLWHPLGIHKWKKGIISYPSLDWNQSNIMVDVMKIETLKISYVL